MELLIFVAVLFLDLFLLKVQMEDLSRRESLLLGLFVLIPLFVLLVIVLRPYVRRKLGAYVIRTEYCWRFGPVILRDPRECHVEFFGRQNMITVKYFHAKELLKVIKI
jgi:hypothetical protein